MAAQAVRKRLVVCVDGTYCTPDGTGVNAASRASLTNVYSIFACVKEAEVTDKHGQRWIQERKYYNGLGALTKPGVSKLNAGAWGTGFKELIREVYGRCCEVSEHDELWLYGFSRGAFVVRAVAGLLHYIRKLKATGTTAFHKHFETALNAYASVQGEGRLGTGQINHLFKVGTVPAPTIRFLGLFDTVKAVKDNGLFNIAPNPSIQHIRHALALHEDRERFTPEYIWPEESDLAEMIRSGRSLVQAWFAGAHLDIGGSALEAGLALYPLQWMMIESRDLGLQLEFHGNVPNAPHIDDPLMLVFPPTEAWGKSREMWSCTVDNRLELKMQDLRAVHVLHEKYSTRYKIKINRDGFHFWVRKPRSIFTAPEKCTKDGSAAATLLGYCASMPLGTVIHPSVYCLIDSDINLIMETKQGELVQYLSEWSGRMLGEVDLKFCGTTKRIPNPGFWSSDDHNEKDVDLPPLRILVCGYVGVGKSTLVGRVFGVDSSTVSERTRGVHNINDEVRIPGRNDFILHDSNGFEGGSAGELEAVQQFVRERVEENDLRKQLHVIWFCVETGSPRVVQRATESFFLAMAECQRHVPVVVVATKKDAFVNQIIGKMAQEGVDIKLCNMIAEEKLREEAGHIEALVTAIHGARVDAVVCVEQNDPQSIAELTKISSSVFQDEKTRLMYVKAQMARPDLKMHMAIYQVMRRYKVAVGTAVGTVNLPFGATGSRQGSKDDICKRIINCFGVQDLNTSKALKIMQSNIKDGMAEGLIMFWSEVIAAGGIACLVFGITAPVIIATAAIGTCLGAPSTARLFLCTAADLILILAKSFQFASLQDRTQPTISDVEASAKAFSNYAQEIHHQICILIPRNNVFRSFSFGKIQARFEALVDEYWHKIATDSVHTAKVTSTSHSAGHRTTTTTLSSSSSSSLSLPRKVSDTHSISSQSQSLTTATTLDDAAAKPRPDDEMEQTPSPRPKRFWRRFSKG